MRRRRCCCHRRSSCPIPRGVGRRAIPAGRGPPNWKAPPRHPIEVIEGARRDSHPRWVTTPGRPLPTVMADGEGAIMSYPSIADHGLIGDLQTSALVATDGTIDWFCCPRFDSPSVFASLLDDRKGGRFALAPVTPATTRKHMYMPARAILVARPLSEPGIAEVIDFMPIDQPRFASDRRRIGRLVRGIRGEVAFEARVEPRFDYARR